MFLFLDIEFTYGNMLCQPYVWLSCCLMGLELKLGQVELFCNMHNMAIEVELDVTRAVGTSRV